MKEELLKGLSEEQIAKVKACKNHEELLAVAKEEGIELSEEQLSAVSGGSCTPEMTCPKCGGKARAYSDGMFSACSCPNCGTFML